ncbi:thiocillin family RiPP [Streptomyces sp. NPDC056149]|uniref:thiocillin family RiPP n=1 Tax=unclassified Streptomyces TaxID=2593676 RepID=UPI003323E4DE
MHRPDTNLLALDAQDAMVIDLSVEDMTVEPLNDSASLASAGCFGTASSASCPGSSASSAGSASSSG